MGDWEDNRIRAIAADKAQALADYAREGGPAGGPENIQPAKVTVLKPRPPEPTLAEEIVAALEELAAAIKSGELIPSHLVIGYGSRTVIDGEAATHYDWDAIGINTYEVIGHLNVYLTRLAMGEGE